jgi:protein-disulfide isomerase
MSERTWSRWQSVVETVALVVVAVAISRIAMVKSAPEPGPGRAGASRPAPPLPSEPVSLAGAQTAGSQTAKVALVVYSDFQCPFCGKFARETLPAIQEQYVRTGKVLFAFRQFPLPIHSFAEKAAEGALCAGQQGKFWAFHDDMFANQQALDPQSLQERARQLGLRTDAFTACLEGKAAISVQADKKAAEPFGVTGTPTFLAGPILKDGRVRVSERFSGALPLAQFQTVLDGLLNKVSGSATAQQ